MQCAASLETVSMCRNSAHRVEGHRAARHCFMVLAAEVGPFLIQLKAFFERDAGQFGSDGTDAFSWDATTFGYGFGGVFVFEIAFGHHMEHRAVRDACNAVRSR